MPRKRKINIFVVSLSGRGDKDTDIYRENIKELDIADDQRANNTN